MTHVSSSHRSDANAASGTWRQRHARIRELCLAPAVSQAHKEALEAASLIQQTDDNAASVFAAHETSARILGDHIDESEELGRKVDVSLAILWSSPQSSGPSVGSNGIDETAKICFRDTVDNGPQHQAVRALRQVASVALSESSRDLTPIRCLEFSREGTVELVRCNLDKCLYVLKSTTKGAAKRNYRTNAPMTERRLLTIAQAMKSGTTTFTPACVASFQSKGSLHILMEYCPAGDLYHFLESAGQAPVANEARSKSGGLLTEAFIRKYAIDMVAAVSWLHEQGYMHRDLKPGNWLFHRSGHLMLCDLASAAPFSRFAEVPASASLAFTQSPRSSRANQRRVLHRHCCLIGTADYIAPEVFWAADLLSRRHLQDNDRTPSISSISLNTDEETLDNEGDCEYERDDEPPPEGPGLYGPECDWWSLGVIIFEMAYKRMPFFSDSIAETMEMIKNHHEYLSFDSWVRCSANLKDLISHLIIRAEDRLGYRSSQEVQAHPFFRDVAWTEPWREPAPFVPHLEDATSGNVGSAEPEPSILHSPQPGQESRSFLARSFGASRMWQGDSADFPNFPNSVELSRAAGLGHVSVASAPAEMSQGNVGAISECNGLTLERRWAAFDPTWIGFTRVPALDAFAKPEASFDESGDILTELDCLPAKSSTPFISRKTEIANTPFVMGKTGDLHRHVLQTASRSKQSQIDRFKTPVRKSSFTSSDTPRETSLRTPNSELGKAPPTSPYPFPVAISSRPWDISVRKGKLRRMDLDRARSASASAGEGSDSRCSGGSNAKRNISEREAWKELKVAVMQSARKSQHREQYTLHSRTLEEAGDSDSEGENGSKLPLRQRVGLPRSLSRRRVSFDPTLGAAANGSTHISSPHRSLPLSVREGLEPVADTRSTHEMHGLAPSISSPLSLQLQDSSVVEDILLDPTDRAMGQPQLTRRQSARQLLLDAQHQNTPTRNARIGVSILPISNGVHDQNKSSAPDVQSAPSSDEAQDRHHTAVSNKFLVSDERRESTPQLVRGTNKIDPPISRQVTHQIVSHLKRQGTLRRRDSHETLSQYRLGINPDDATRLEGTERAPSAERLPLHHQGSMNKIDALRSNSSLSLMREGNVSSPSFPSVPDAFIDPGRFSSGESNASISEPRLQSSQQKVKAISVNAEPRHVLRPIHDNHNEAERKCITPEVQLEIQRSATLPSSGSGFIFHDKHRSGHGSSPRSTSSTCESTETSSHSQPSLLQREDVSLRALQQGARRSPNRAGARSAQHWSSAPSPSRRALAQAEAETERTTASLIKANKTSLADFSTAPTIAEAASSSLSTATSSSTVTRLHARYDVLQADIEDLERRLSRVRDIIATSAE